MKCYMCAKDEKSTDAVAVCVICGMGLCMDHSIEKEVPLVTRTSGWAAKEVLHILCAECAKIKSLTA